MLRIDRTERTLRRLEEPQMAESDIWERQDLQRMVRSSPDAFFSEMGEELHLLAEELRPTDVVDDRIDLLAVDREGALVILELKRGSHKLQLLQSLTYAAMVAKWETGNLIETYASFSKQSIEDAQETLEGFLDSKDVGSLNQRQRVVLLAESFDFSVLATAEWLAEKYEVDIRCYRLKLSRDGDAHFLSCTCIYPPQELAEVAVRRGAARSATRRTVWADWETALDAMENRQIADFYREQLSAGRQNSLARRILRFRSGRLRFTMRARKHSVYIWQYRRFVGDLQFWRSKFGPHADVSEVRDGSALSFSLTSRKDLEAFGRAVDGELGHAELTGSEAEPEADDE